MRTVALSFSMLVATFLLFVARVSAGEKGRSVRVDVLARVEEELGRLAKKAAKEAGSVQPPPSSEVAFLLLTGLAAQGTPVKQPPAEEFRRLGLAPSNRVKVQIFSVAANARIAITAEAIQDKSGYWTSKRATLYRRQGGKWIRRGSGSTAIDGAPLTD
jgi:hypothetical protein